MIFGIGTDIVEIKRIETMTSLDKFASKILSHNEKEFYDYMLSYSPYDNIRSVEYPNTLVTTGLHDSQVQYWEPAKWVAKLRDYHKGDNKIILHTNMDAGHGGASGRFKILKEVAMEYAFLIGIEKKLL